MCLVACRLPVKVNVKLPPIDVLAVRDPPNPTGAPAEGWFIPFVNVYPTIASPNLASIFCSAVCKLSLVVIPVYINVLPS